MNDSLGNALLLKIVLFIIIAVMLLFVSALSYSKAYKAKNIVIDSIEAYGMFNDKAKAEIELSFAELGYQVDNDFVCPKVGDMKSQQEISNYKGYKYCVYEVCIGDCKGNRGKYYKVVTYTQFKFPIIESVITMPVRGETKILGKSYNY